MTPPVSRPLQDGPCGRAAEEPQARFKSSSSTWSHSGRVQSSAGPSGPAVLEHAIHNRPTLFAVAAATLLSVALAPSAQAKQTTESIDRTLFDATPERTAGSLRLDGPTNGELGGALDLTITAVDGTEKPKLVGDSLIATSQGLLGGLATFSGVFR